MILGQWGTLGVYGVEAVTPPVGALSDGINGEVDVNPRAVSVKFANPVKVGGVAVYRLNMPGEWVGESAITDIAASVRGGGVSVEAVATSGRMVEFRVRGVAKSFTPVSLSFTAGNRVACLACYVKVASCH
ncbi:MAG: hypothetical protein CMI01_00185 [Oceanospirillaceae bacterium]|nr:hypothetical protein [Oceanospirillaceae bacterium]|tara:strand:+ start:278 stop:670 length:393 start_codon:yes stop_codon:yes gene_type:complete